MSGWEMSEENKNKKTIGTSVYFGLYKHYIKSRHESSDAIDIADISDFI